MYGLPKNIDLSFFHDRELIQVCIGPYQVQFHFDKDVRIFVQNAFSYVDAGGAIVEIKTAPSSAILVDKLMGKTVKVINPSQNGTLQIAFNTGEQLIFCDDTKGYECYLIQNGEQTIVV